MFHLLYSDDNGKEFLLMQLFFRLLNTDKPFIFTLSNFMQAEMHVITQDVSLIEFKICLTAVVVTQLIFKYLLPSHQFLSKELSWLNEIEEMISFRFLSTSGQKLMINYFIRSHGQSHVVNWQYSVRSETFIIPFRKFFFIFSFKKLLVQYRDF